MKKNILYLIFFILILGYACNPKITSTFYTLTDGSSAIPSAYSEETILRNKNKPNKCCREKESYIPDTTHLEFMPEKHIRINFHLMNSADSTNNHQEKEGVKYVKNLLGSAKAHYRNNKRMLLHPQGKETPVLPTLYHYILTPNGTDPDDDGIYFHYDDQLYFYITKGKNKNNYTKDVIKKYGIGLDSVMNIFLMPPHPDSIKSKTYTARSSGIALRNAIKITGAYALDVSAWELSAILNHEVGHNYGLPHAWGKNDGCDDTPPNPNCYYKGSTRGEANCDSLLSNNLMDYNYCQCAWTPCQIGRIHKNISWEKGRGRKFVIPDWCTLDKKRSITIQDSIVWRGEMDLYGHLTIEKGASLEIKCRVSLPKNAKITVAPGAKLILNNARLHNACGDEWQGIELQKSGKEKGEVVLIGIPEIKNVANKEKIE